MKSVWPILEGYMNEVRDNYHADLSNLQDEEYKQELLQLIEEMEDEYRGIFKRLADAIYKGDSKTFNDYLSYMDHEPRGFYMKVMHLIGQEHSDKEYDPMKTFKPTDLWTGMQRNTPFGKRPPRPADDEE